MRRALACIVALAATSCAELIGVDPWEPAASTSAASTGNMGASSSSESASSGGAGAGGACAAWAHGLGSTLDDDLAAGLAVAPNGDAAISGSLGAEAHIAELTLTPSGADAFVARFDSTGALGFAKLFGNADSQAATGVAFDDAGDLAIVGHTAGVINLGGSDLVSQGDADVFVAKLHADATHVWSASFGDAQVTAGPFVARPLDSTLIIAGAYGSAAFVVGAELPAPPSGKSAMFVALIDEGGSPKWSAGVAGSGDVVAHGVARDQAGNAIVVGHFDGTADFGSGPLTAEGPRNAFVTKRDASGAPLWTRLFAGADGYQAANAVATGEGGEIYVTGIFSGTVAFGSVTYFGPNYDAFVVRMDPAGAVTWAKRFGGQGQDEGNDVAIGPNGSVLITGRFQSSATFAGPLVSAGDNDAFVMALDSSGSPLWSVRAGDGASQIGTHVAAHPCAGVLVAGTSAGDIDWGSGVVRAVGGTDAFIAAIPGGTPP